MFLDFKVKEISHAKEGTSTGTELSASYCAARAQPQSGIPKRKKGTHLFKQVNRTFLDFKVKEISHAKEGTSTGTELSASYCAARAQPQSGIPRR